MEQREPTLRDVVARLDKLEQTAASLSAQIVGLAKIVESIACAVGDTNERLDSSAEKISEMHAYVIQDAK